MDHMSELARRAKVAAGIAARYADDVDRESRFPHEAFEACKAERLLSAAIPIELGGRGAALSEIAMICYLLSQRCSSTGLIFAMHQNQLACAVRHALGSAWHDRLMRRAAQGELLFASATSEVGIGGNIASSRCAVERTGSQFVLIKDAPVISYGDEADIILVTARKSDSSVESDQVLVALEKGQFHLQRISTWDAMGMRGTCSHGYRISGKGDLQQILPTAFGEILACTLLPSAHILWSCVWLGIATDAVRRARSFLRQKSRKGNGDSLTAGTRLANLARDLQLMRSYISTILMRYSSQNRDRQDITSFSFTVGVSLLKVATSQLSTTIVQQALEICGIAGYVNNSSVSLSRHLRDIYSASLMVGNDRISTSMSQVLMIHDIEDDSLSW